MDVTDLVRRFVRRRWAVLAVVVLAVVAALVAGAGAGGSQQSSAAVVIVPPKLGDAVSEENPLLNLDNNLAQLATVLSAAMQSADVGDALARKNATAAFTVSTITGSDPSFAQLSPQLVFTVTGSSAATARRTAAGLVDQARSQLSSLQSRAGVPSSARATLLQVVPPTAGESVGGGRVRSAGVAFLVVLVLGLLAVLLVDEVLRRRFSAPSVADRPVPARRRAARLAAQRDPDALPPTPRSR